MTEFLALVATTVISVMGALVSVFYAHRLRRAAQVEEADQLAVRFREPVLQAAFNLQSRLYNIVRQDFLDDFLVGDTSSPEEREYAVLNTAYLIGQYLGWVEAIRRESQYMDPRSRSRNREIVDRLERVRDTFAESRELKDPTLRLFRGEQRAIGEVMLVPTDSATVGVPRWECKGYARFIDEQDVDKLQRWFRPIENDVATLAKEPHKDHERLVKLQHELVDLIEILDPLAERVPPHQRQRL
jgi:hypothetical protein